MESRAVYRVGFWSSLLATAMVAGFALSLVIGLLSPSYAADAMSYVTCLILPASFVVMMVSIHRITPPDRRVWSQLGLSFSIVYAVMCSMVYYIQLVVVRTNSLGVSPDAMALFAFTPGSAMFAVDMLGYAFLTLATLVTSPVFGDSLREKWLKRLFFVHGLFALPTIVFPALRFSQDSAAVESTSRGGSVALLFWCLLFLPISTILAVHFRRLQDKAVLGALRPSMDTAA
jgi:hypothetical protein